MKIRVVSSKPNYLQEEIKHLIGEEFDVISYDKESGEISILEKGQTQQTILNQEEYEFI